MITGDHPLTAFKIAKDLKLTNGSNIEAAKEVGELVAKRAVKAGIKVVVFDRGGYIYHGKVKASTEALPKNFRNSTGSAFCDPLRRKKQGAACSITKKVCPGEGASQKDPE